MLFSLEAILDVRQSTRLLRSDSSLDTVPTVWSLGDLHYLSSTHKPRLIYWTLLEKTSRQVWSGPSPRSPLFAERSHSSHVHTHKPTLPSDVCVLSLMKKFSYLGETLLSAEETSGRLIVGDLAGWNRDNYKTSASNKHIRFFIHLRITWVWINTERLTCWQ